MTEFVTSPDGTRLAHDVFGSGERPVIFVAGAIQHRAIDQTTPRIAELLGQGFSSIVFDRRGRGESSDSLPYSIDREIEDIAALVSSVGGSAALFGHSSGAVLALDAAARGVGVTKLALYEAPLTTDDGSPPSEDPYLVALKQILASGDRGGAVTHFMRLTGIPETAIEAARASAAWPALEAVAPTLAYDGTIIAEAQSQPWEQQWGAIAVPTLVMEGSASFAFMAAAAQKLTAVLPDATWITLQGQTHNPEREVIAPVLREFLLA